MSRECRRATVIRPPSLFRALRPWRARCLLISARTRCSGEVCVERGTFASATGTAASARATATAHEWRRRSTGLASTREGGAGVPRGRGACDPEGGNAQAAPSPPRAPSQSRQIASKPHPPCRRVSVGSLPAMATMYELAGGAAGIRRLTDRFYALVFADDLLAPLFHQHDDHHADRLAMWLTELFGGPAEHREHRGGFEVMRGAHQDLRITEPQRARWAQLMFR